MYFIPKQIYHDCLTPERFDIKHKYICSLQYVLLQQNTDTLI